MVIYEDNLDVNIRPAVVADAIAMIDLHFAAVHQSAGGFYQPEVLNSWSTQPDETRYDHIRRALEKEEELFVVAEDASGVIGFGSIVPLSQELRAVYVHPRAGRRGVGSAILRCLEQLALDRGVLELQMDASINAEAFYRRTGFEILERGVHPISTFPRTRFTQEAARRQLEGRSCDGGVEPVSVSGNSSLAKARRRRTLL